MAEERTKRRLAAILAADVVGFSRLMEADEAGTLAALKARRKEVLDPLLAKHLGRVFKVTGDGVLLEFASAVNAVRCAIELQHAMEAANADLPPNRQFRLRVGINLGDVIADGSDLYGDGVNVASRLEALAEPGSILIAGTVHDHTKSKLDATFEDLGSQTVKNLTQPIHVYRVVMAVPDEGSPASARRADPLTLPTKPSIAVLPFTNMSGDPGQSYLSDGITEDIITELSRFRSLFVIARNSSFAYRGESTDVRRIGRELGVRFIVEGSFRRAGERIRITAQLIEAATGNHLWAERYDREIGDLFAVQDEVARTIVATLAGQLEDAEVRSVARKPTESLPAYDCLLRGIEHLWGYAAEDNRLAAEMFERAIALDPRFALPHAYLALTLLIVHGFADAPDPIKARALASALTAVRLDPKEARCHRFLAQAYLYRGEYDQAMTHFERSVALNPNDADCIATMGLAVAYVGRAEEGIELIHQAMRLNPHHPNWYWTNLAMAQYAARRYEDAVESSSRDPYRESPLPLARKAACYAQAGRTDEARALAAEILQLKPDFHLSGVTLGYKNPADAEHVFEGMRKAGLPE
jgi:TolB-like protein/class 3 adenylate cyclase/Flp pilus assembly protein TadD